MDDTRKIEDNSVGKEVPRDGGQLAVESRKLLEQTAVQTGVDNTSDKSVPKLTLEGHSGLAETIFRNSATTH